MPPLVDAGVDIISISKTVHIAAKIDESAVKIKWEVSKSPLGSKTIIINPGTASTDVILDQVGVYELKVTAEDNAQNIASDSVTVTKQVSTIAFDSLTVDNIAADGYINSSESNSEQPLISALLAENFDNAEYAVVLANIECNEKVIYSQEKPTIASIIEDGAYKVCVKLSKSGTVIYERATPTLIRDTIAPSGAITIAGTAAGFSQTRSLTIMLSREADVTEYQLCSAPAVAGSDCTSVFQKWTKYTDSSITFSFLTDGPKVLYIQFKDHAGNISETIASNVVTIDTVPPQKVTGASVPSIVMAALPVTFTYAATSQALQFNFKACLTSDCSTQCVGADSTGTSPGVIDSAALTSGIAYYGCVQAVDSAGNKSQFVASPSSALFDSTPPSGAISLTSTGGGYSNTRSPPITLSRDPDVGQYQLCASASASGQNCNNIIRAWSSYTDTPASYGFSSDGVKVLYVQFKDLAGNIGATVESNSLTIDTLVPSDVSGVSIPVVSNTDVSISFIPGSEANPNGYNLKACTASNCSSGCVGSTTTLNSPGIISTATLSHGVSYYGCVQPIDVVGNVGNFVASASPMLFDSVAPSGSISLAETISGYAATRSPAITLTRDADAVEYQLCSNSATSGQSCSGVLRAWSAYSDNPPAYDFGSDGAKVLYVQLRDLVGNIGDTVVSNSLIIDSLPPGNVTGVSVPATSTGEVTITFIPGTEANPNGFNLKACATSSCDTGCVGSTTISSSPGTLSSAALSSGHSYYGCVQPIDVVGNLGNFISSTSSVYFSNTAPTGTISIAESVSGYAATHSPSITLTRDPNAVQYQLCSNSASTGQTCTGILRSWTTYADNPASYDFGSDGSKVLYVQFKDFAGNIGATAASNTLKIDTLVPDNVTGVTVPTVTNTDVVIGFTPGTEANPNGFNLKACTTSSCDSGCVAATTSTNSPGTLLAAALSQGVSYYGCVQPIDAVGNLGDFVSSVSTVVFDSSAPSGSISLAESVSGYSTSRSPAITLTRSSDAEQYQLCSNSATVGQSCSGVLRAWAPYSDSPPSYDFGSDGAKVIYVQFKDLAGNIGATVTSNSLIIDTVTPGDVMGVTVPVATNTDIVISFTPGIEANPDGFNLKACTNSGCSTGCVGAAITTNSPGTIAASALSDGVAYYGCVQAVDASGFLGNFVPSVGTVLFDVGAPSGSIALAESTIGFAMTRTPTITLTRDPDTVQYQLCSGSSPSGQSCAGVLRPWTTYADNPASYDFGSDGSNALYVQFKDLAGNIGATVASNTLTIDTLVPGDVTGVSVPSTGNSDVVVSFTPGLEINPDGFNIKACTASNCTSGCVGVTTTTSSPGTISASALADGISYYACVQAIDKAGHLANFVPSTAASLMDTTPPSGTISLSQTIAGYSSTQTLGITLTRDPDAAEYQLCSNSALQGQNCTGVLRSWAAYSDSPTPFNIGTDGNKVIYVQFKDLGGNIGATVVSNSVIVDTIDPAEVTNINVPSAATADFQITFTPGIETNPSNFNIKACADSTCSTGCVGATTTATSPGTISRAALTSASLYYGCVQPTDAAGHVGNFTASSGQVFADEANPSGSIALGATVPGYSNTRTPGITLTRVASVADYQLCSNTAAASNSCTGVLRSWTPYTDTPPAYDFGSDGTKNIYVQFRTGGGSIGSTVASNTLIIDTTPPGNVTGVTVPSNANAIFPLTFSQGAEANPASYNIKMCTANDCTTGCVGSTTGASSPVSISTGALTSSLSYYGCVQATDQVGQTASFVASSSPVLFDLNKPSGTISLAQTMPGYSATRSPAITLTRDTNVVEYQLCSSIANAGNNCTGILRAWTAFATNPSPYTFGADGSQMLYVQFKDDLGNIGPTVSSNTLTIDSVSPGAFSITSCYRSILMRDQETFRFI